jgi:3',5'-cyclic AMP phosphodiesterase CpdA
MFKGLISIILFFLTTYSIYSQDLPVNRPDRQGYNELSYSNVRNLYSVEMLYNTVKNGDADGLKLDLTSIDKLLDGSRINPNNIYGNIYVGPYPFESSEAKYVYKRFREESIIKNGQGTIKIASLLGEKTNSENWVDRGTVLVRLKLFLEETDEDTFLGVYDFPVNFYFSGNFTVQPSITEGPFVYNVSSDEPTKINIYFRTSLPTKTTLNVGGVNFEDKETNIHDFEITGLQANSRYIYTLDINGIKSREYNFFTAPLKGSETVSFAFTGDSREGVGGGEHEFMGINANVLEKLVNIATTYRNIGVKLFLFGGDLVNGYTSSKDDFSTMLYAFKQIVSPYWCSYPFYSVMGNHESLLRIFSDGKKQISLDRWPYDLDSSESLFADNFFNPVNGPVTTDNRRPSYKENVFSFTYGNIKFIGFNNNYWYSSDPQNFGGSPEGYIMNDQLSWIKEELKKADADDYIKYIILVAQEPIFPNGGHISDAMWYKGNNNIKAYTYRNGRLEGETKGIIDVRNEFVEAVTSSKKVAAVLTSDEHAYHKMLLTKNVPIGNPSKDDKNGNGIICEQNETCSPLNIEYSTWFITSGGAGAPYYSEESTPWNTYLKNRGDSNNYKYSSQYNILIFEEIGGRLALTVQNAHGEEIDRIGDLTSSK